MLNKYHGDLDGYLKPQQLTKREYTNVFFGAFIVASLQLIVLGLIVN